MYAAQPAAVQMQLQHPPPGGVAAHAMAPEPGMQWVQQPVAGAVCMVGAPWQQQQPQQQQPVKIYPAQPLPPLAVAPAQSSAPAAADAPAELGAPALPLPLPLPAVRA
jgi:hypothetical protein